MEEGAGALQRGAGQQVFDQGDGRTRGVRHPVEEDAYGADQRGGGVAAQDLRGEAVPAAHRLVERGEVVDGDGPVQGLGQRPGQGRGAGSRSSTGPADGPRHHRRPGPRSGTTPPSAAHPSATDQSREASPSCAVEAATRPAPVPIRRPISSTCPAIPSPYHSATGRNPPSDGSARGVGSAAK